MFCCLLSLPAADTGSDKCKRCKMRVAQYPSESMQIRPGASDVLCSGKESVREASAKKIDR